MCRTVVMMAMAAVAAHRAVFHGCRLAVLMDPVQRGAAAGAVVVTVTVLMPVAVTVLVVVVVAVSVPDVRVQHEQVQQVDPNPGQRQDEHHCTAQHGIRLMLQLTTGQAGTQQARAAMAGAMPTAEASGDFLMFSK